MRPERALHPESHLRAGADLDITVVPAGADHATIRVTGELDLANSDLLAAILDHQLRRGRRYLRLDLSRLAFADCAAVRVIVHAHNKTLHAGGRLVLAHITGPMSTLLRMTELDEALFLDRGERRRHLALAPEATR